MLGLGYEFVMLLFRERRERRETQVTRDLEVIQDQRPCIPEMKRLY